MHSIDDPAYPSLLTIGCVNFASLSRDKAATLNFTQLAAWYDWLPWREWRLGEQLPVTRLVAEEFAAIVDKAGVTGQS
jgi:hypothetical protein